MLAPSLTAPCREKNPQECRLVAERALQHGKKNKKQKIASELFQTKRTLRRRKFSRGQKQEAAANWQKKRPGSATSLLEDDRQEVRPITTLAFQNAVCGLSPGWTRARSTRSTERIHEMLRPVAVWLASPIRVTFKCARVPKLPTNAATSVAAGRTFDAAAALEVK